MDGGLGERKFAPKRNEGSGECPNVPRGREHRRTQAAELPDDDTGFAAYACEHVVSTPAQLWFSREADEEPRWPDAWCATADAFFQEQGESNEKNESKIKMKLLCHHCYERLRSRSFVSKLRCCN
jgi:hypothetical protein